MNYYFTYGLLIPLLASILLIIILYSQNKKSKKLVEKLIFEKHDLETLRKDEIKDYFKEEWSREENELDNRLRLKREAIKFESTKLESDFQVSKTELDGLLRQMEVLLKEKEKRYNEVNQDLDLYKQGKMKEIDGTAAEYEQRKHNLIDQSIEKYRNKQMTLANAMLELMQAERDDYLKEIEEIKTDLEAERSKRAAINEEIRRQKEVEMKQDFYRIQFNEEDKNDVEILRSIAPRLRHPEAINKVIWSAYYQKPLAELRKRVAIEGSGIYKITRIKTGEIYIGKAHNVSDRWTSHVKTALGVGTLASSQLHRVMAADGCENFLFELLEEVPKDKLSERESYYIDFYDSKNYGLNTIRGEQNK